MNETIKIDFKKAERLVNDCYGIITDLGFMTTYMAPTIQINGNLIVITVLYGKIIRKEFEKIYTSGKYTDVEYDRSVRHEAISKVYSA